MGVYGSWKLKIMYVRVYKAVHLWSRHFLMCMLYVNKKFQNCIYVDLNVMFHHYFLYFLKMTIKLLLPLFNFPQNDFPLQWKSVEQHLGKFLGKSLLTLENWLPHATHQVQIPDPETQAALCLVALA